MNSTETRPTMNPAPLTTGTRNKLNLANPESLYSPSSWKTEDQGEVLPKQISHIELQEHIGLFLKNADKNTVKLKNDCKQLTQSTQRHINILILGETGVGKSTWINAFTNYLSYKSFLEAKNGQLYNPIPVRFTLCGKNYENVNVTIGDNKAGIFKAGQSDTQKANIYTVSNNNEIIRLIDTPGIGDSRGIRKDFENWSHVLSVLESIDELHGICILLKPNNSRATSEFQYCIKELLSRLPNDACKNIVICFTNSRGTFYKPGDTMASLRSILDKVSNSSLPLTKETVFCFDSEAYRMLAAVKYNRNIKFDENEMQDFSQSWEKSSNEIQRMLEQIRSIPGHNTKQTLSLNHFCKLWNSIASVLAELKDKIKGVSAIMADHEEKRKTLLASLKELKRKRMTTRKTLNMIETEHPKTVCSNSKCTNRWVEDGTVKIEYVNVCHDLCGCLPAPCNYIGDHNIMQCVVINNGVCKNSKCGHSYREHLHVFYDTKIVSVKVEDDSVKSEIAVKKTAAEKGLVGLKSKKKLLSEYEKEEEVIKGVAVKLAKAISKKALFPYNDAIKEYVELEISKENSSVQTQACKINVRYLEELRASVIYKESIFTGSGKNKTFSSEKPINIDNLVDKLKSLKHSEEKLKLIIRDFEYGKKIVPLENATTDDKRCVIV